LDAATAEGQAALDELEQTVAQINFDYWGRGAARMKNFEIAQGNIHDRHKHSSKMS